MRQSPPKRLLTIGTCVRNSLRDVLIVVKLDHLGRNTRDVLNLVHELEEKGASLRVLEPPIDTAGPVGRMVLTVLGMVAEMELGFIRDRQRAGIDAAKGEGDYKGRSVTFDRARIVSLRKEGVTLTRAAPLGAQACSGANDRKEHALTSPPCWPPIKWSERTSTRAVVTGYMAITKK